jgi:FkbM family methyltransferase
MFARLKRLVQAIASRTGVEIRRRPDATLPFIHELDCSGRKMHFWIANPHAKSWWYVPALHMNAEFRTLREFCAPGSVVLDVGAHHGIHTIPFGLWAGESGQVHAFELNAENALVLHANVALNRLSNCYCNHAGVGEISGILHASGEAVASDGKREVRAWCLDDYCAARNLSRVDVIKVDVEGFEAQVLRGARQLLATLPHLAIEVHMDEMRNYGSSVADVLSAIDCSRYDVQVMVRPDWDNLRPWKSQMDLPTSGVINIFFRSPIRSRARVGA